MCSNARHTHCYVLLCDDSRVSDRQEGAKVSTRGISPDVEAKARAKLSEQQATKGMPFDVLPAMEKADRSNEKQLQAGCEQYLRLRGYLRLTPDNAKHTPRGWFSHYPGKRAKGNHQMPDLSIYDPQHRKPPLMVELKVRNHYEPGQAEHIASGFWLEIRTLKDFVETLKEWEDRYP